MDNHITIFSGEPGGNHSMAYMPYRLLTTDFPPGRLMPTEHNRLAFFSLKQALCTLILSDLNRIGPRLERCITDGSGDQLYARLYQVQPFEPLAPGVYFETHMDPKAIWPLIGPLLPFDSENLPSGLQLAAMDKEGAELRPTDIYLLLRQHAESYMEEISRNIGDFPLQATFLGRIHELEQAGIAGENLQNRFIEQHFFSHPAEGLRIMLQKDPRYFDVVECERKYSYIHEQGFMLDLNSDITAQIITVPITPTMPAYPGAGIFLYCPAGIGTFEQETGVSLQQLNGYDPASQYLCLASYQYDRGFSITVDKLLLEVIKGEDICQFITGVQPEGDFVVSASYRFQPQKEIGQPFILATDHYHCQSYDRALLKLLETDFSLFDNYLQPMGSYFLSSISIGRGNILKTTKLEMDMQPGADSNRRIPQLVMQFYPEVPMRKELAEGLRGLEGYAEVLIANRQIRILPVARADQWGMMQPMSDNIAGLRKLLDTGTGQGQGQEKQRAPGELSGFGYCLELLWENTMGTAGKPEWITVHDLSIAFNLLLGLRPEQFTTAKSSGSEPRIKSATIFDQVENKALATYFYERAATQTDSGMRLNLLAQRSDLMALVAAQPGFTPLKALGGDHIQYQDSRQEKQSTCQHLRIIDDKNGGPSSQQRTKS